MNEIQSKPNSANDDDELLIIDDSNSARAGWIRWCHTPAARTLVIICSTLIPILSFSFAAGGTHWGALAPWQSGTWDVYFGLFLSRPTQVAFYPILIFSAGCIVIWAINPKRFASSFIVRLGVLTGIFWALIFSVLAFPNLLSFAVMVLVGFVLWVIVWCVLLPMARFHPAKYFCSLIAVLVILLALIAVAGQFTQRNFIEYIGIPFLVAAIFGPVLTLFSFLLVATSFRFDFRSIRFSLAKVFGIMVYIGAFLGTWRIAIDRMLIEYSKLPTEDPNCFVSAAAAYGYPGIVSAELTHQDGKSIRLTQQMKWLKAGEFALQATLPKCHAIVRRIYNRVGPFAATVIKRSRVLATLSFLMLLPIEFCIRILLRVLQIDRSRVRSLYRKTRQV